MKIMLEGNTVDELYDDLQVAKAVIEATMGENAAETKVAPAATTSVPAAPPVLAQPAATNGSGQPQAAAPARHGFNDPVTPPGRARRRNKATMDWDEANHVKMAERKKLDAWKHSNPGMDDATALTLVRGNYGPAAAATPEPQPVAQPVQMPLAVRPGPVQPVPAQLVPAPPAPQTATGDPYMGLGQQVQQPQAFPVNQPAAIPTSDWQAQVVMPNQQAPQADIPPVLPMPGQQPQAAPALQTPMPPAQPMQAPPQPQLPPTDGVTLPAAPAVNPAGHAPAGHANPAAGAPVTDDMMRSALHNLQTAVGVPYAIELMNKYGVTDVAQFPVELRPQIVAEIDAQVRAVE